MIRPMRRKDRVMDAENIERVLKENSHGVLATVSEDGWPYAHPISYVYHDGHVYFHSAASGHKVDNITRDNRATFTVIGRVEMKTPTKAEAYFESVILFGRVERVTDFEEQVASMTELMNVFMPLTAHETRDDLTRMQKAVIVYRLDAEHVSGKLRGKGAVVGH
ncbi:MAG: pyridoxamine 5'-phosphate oxidase family protein [Clostridiales Family XIII bacterium]|nr:pyridoxamine 5'-phosphate oxidase family protein [Clostridiales Family XIII bacterium]